MLSRSVGPIMSVCITPIDYQLRLSRARARIDGLATAAAAAAAPSRHPYALSVPDSKSGLD